MASKDNDDNILLWLICGVALLLCCGGPVYLWRAVNHAEKVLAEMEPVAVSFLDAWRDGDLARAEPLTCDSLRTHLADTFRRHDLVSYGKVDLDIHRNRGADESYQAESNLTFADGGRNRYQLILEGGGTWQVCRMWDIGPR